MNPSPLPELSVVVIVSAEHAARLPAFAQALAAPQRPAARIETLWVVDDAVRVLPAVREHFGLDSQAAGRTAGATVVASLAEAVARASAPWLALRHPGVELPHGHLDTLAAFLQTGAAGAGVVVCGAPPPAATQPVMPAAWADAPPAWHACALRRDRLVAAGLTPDARLRPQLAADLLLWRALLLPGQTLAWAGGPEPAAATAQAEPPAAVWRDKTTYAQAVQHAFAEPLEQAAATQGTAPRWLQLAVLRHLAWYYTVDARERAPTVVVDEPMAVVFHDLVGRALRQVDMALLDHLPATLASPEVCHALWSYQAPQLHSPPVADAYDHDQGLMRLSYWHHGTPPAERFVADGQPLQPAFAKQRACNWFRRRLLRQRIAWLPVAHERELRVELGGRAVAVAVGKQRFSVVAVSAASGIVPLAMDKVRTALRAGKADLQQPLPPGWAGWKVRLIKALARFAPVRRYYRDAWVFVDRDVDADDSAEHLYRWVREHHPEINAWFLLYPESPDWPRLRAEGFRLFAPGLRRRLLALNCKHIVSSHTGQEFGLDPARYGDMMGWRYTFLQHGTIKDDISHWLNPSAFDVFVTSSPAEHDSVVGNDTPYIYTDREVVRAGLPRHDRLLRIARDLAREEVRLLLVMPTWRGSLIDEGMDAAGPAERLAAFAQSEYARRWRSLLNNEMLLARVREAGLRLTFVPHTNAEPYVEAFAPAKDVDVVKLSSGMAQQTFARAAAFVTDYTSVAFEMALLRRPVFYYQFDQMTFYSGGHNWREGYFDYQRDGFGPVALDERALLAELDTFLASGCRPQRKYIERMGRAMPLPGGTACEAVFNAILDTRRPSAGDRGAQERTSAQSAIRRRESSEPTRLARPGSAAHDQPTH